MNYVVVIPVKHIDLPCSIPSVPTSSRGSQIRTGSTVIETVAETSHAVAERTSHSPQTCIIPCSSSGSNAAMLDEESTLAKDSLDDDALDLVEQFSPGVMALHRNEITNSKLETDSYCATTPCMVFDLF